MQEASLRDLIAAQLGKLRILFGAFAASVLVFAVVVNVAKGPVDGSDPVLPLVLGVAALGEVVMLFVMRHMMMGTVALRMPEDRRVGQTVDGEALGAAVRKASGRYFTGSIVGFAISESVALLGFVAAFVGGEPIAYLPYAGAALLLLAVQFPTTGGLLSILTPEERAGARRALGL